MRLDVILDFFFQFLCSVFSRNQNDSCLYNLPADIVRRCGYPAFQNIRQFHDHAFDLKRPDPVSGGLNDVVYAADIPEEPVFVLPRCVAGMVISVPPDLCGLFLVPVIAGCKSARRSLVDPDNNFSDFTDRNALSFLIHEFDLIYRRRFSHRSDLMRCTDQVSDDHSAFGLPEAFHDLQSCRFFELPVHFRVQRFSRGGHMLHGREIVMRQILLDHHSKDCRRRAERCDMILCKHRENIRCVEPVKVIYERCCFAQPLPVQFSPHRLCPAGVGNGKMQPVRVHRMPVLCCMEVPERIPVVMRCDLRIS